MSKIKVLLVDDEIAFTTPLSRRLKKRGFDIQLVMSGMEALKILKNEAFDVVLLDVSMPGIDGIKTLGKIKQRDPHLEIVMLTAHANSDFVISSLAMGAFDYLIKPVDLNVLIGKIEDAAKRRKQSLADGVTPLPSTALNSE